MENVFIDPAHQLAALTSFADRRPGSPGNDAAVELAAEVLQAHGWEVTTPEFDVVHWQGGEASLEAAGQRIALSPSPYGTAAEVTGTLVTAGTPDALAALARSGAAAGRVLLVHGDVTREPLTPAGFPFYSVPEHDRLRALLTGCRPAAVVAVTGRAPAVAGAVEPFAFVEDGDFPIPAADVRPAEGDRLLALGGSVVTVRIDARRRPARARNVVARRGGPGPRAVVTAHVDSKPGTPGALDNAAGVVTLLQVAARLVDDHPAELVVLNGEDYFGASGEVDYLKGCGGPDAPLDDVRIAVNIDGAGHRDGRAAWSLYNLEGPRAAGVREILTRPGLVAGEQWWQSDHAVFAMRGRPAVAFTSEHFERLLAELVHTAADTPDVVDVRQLVTVAEAVADLVRG